MKNKTCGECKFYCNDAAFCSRSGVGWKKKTDMVCKNFEPIPKPTVFQKITQSPEVLAPLLIWEDYDWAVFRSSIIDGDGFHTREEAIAATVAKLKEKTESEAEDDPGRD